MAATGAYPQTTNSSAYLAVSASNRQAWPNDFQPKMNRRMQTLLSNGGSGPLAIPVCVALTALPVFLHHSHS